MGLFLSSDVRQHGETVKFKGGDLGDLGRKVPVQVEFR